MANQFFYGDAKSGLRRTRIGQRPGLLKLYLFPQRALVRISYPTISRLTLPGPFGSIVVVVPAVITQPIVVKESTPVVTAEFVEASYREEQIQGDGGPLIRTTIRVTNPFHDNDNHDSLNQMKYERWFLIACFRDQPMRLIGDLENGAEMTHMYDAGNPKKSVASAEVEFRYTSEDKPLLYQPILPSGSLIPIVYQ